LSIFCSSTLRQVAPNQFRIFARLWLLLEQEKTLAGLPFLIGKFAGRCLQEVMVVRDGRYPIV
jgi:hypothetical protein